MILGYVPELGHGGVTKCIPSGNSLRRNRWWCGVRASKIVDESTGVSAGALVPRCVCRELAGVLPSISGAWISRELRAAADKRGAIAEPRLARKAEARTGRHVRSEDHKVSMVWTASTRDQIDRATKGAPEV